MFLCLQNVNATVGGYEQPTIVNKQFLVHKATAYQFGDIHTNCQDKTCNVMLSKHCLFLLLWDAQAPRPPLVQDVFIDEWEGVPVPQYPPLTPSAAGCTEAFLLAALSLLLLTDSDNCSVLGWSLMSAVQYPDVLCHSWALVHSSIQC